MSNFPEYSADRENYETFQSRDHELEQSNEARYQRELYADDQTHVRDEGDAAENFLEETGCTLAEASAFRAMVDRKPAKIESTKNKSEVA